MKLKLQTMLRQGTEYRILHKQIKNKYKQAKQEWLNEKCTEIEILFAFLMLKLIELTGQRQDQQDVQNQRWNEYSGELFRDERGKLTSMKEP